MSHPERGSSTEDEGVVAAPVFRDVLGNAIRYWERRRLLYNAVLVLVVVFRFIAAWPTSQQALYFDNLLTLFILAVLANVAYCAAYIPDIAIQYSSMRRAWLEWRFVLLVIGILFASALTFLVAESVVYQWSD